MTREEIAALFARRQEAYQGHDVESLVVQHTEDCVLQSPMAGTVRGRKAVAEVYQAWFKAFPDLSFEVGEDLIIDGDRVAQMGTFVGTDIGGFMGLPPTGKPFRAPVVWIYTVKEGHIAFEWPVYDFTGLLVQIGVVKAKYA